MTVQNKAKPATREKRWACQSCGIMIAEGYEEESGLVMGEYILCQWCYGQLIKFGRREIDRKTFGRSAEILWLFPDGSTKWQKAGEDKV